MVTESNAALLKGTRTTTLLIGRGRISKRGASAAPATKDPIHATMGTSAGATTGATNNATTNDARLVSSRRQAK